jgi:hypothetical protein
MGKWDERMGAGERGVILYSIGIHCVLYRLGKKRKKESRYVYHTNRCSVNAGFSLGMQDDSFSSPQSPDLCQHTLLTALW